MEGSTGQTADCRIHRTLTGQCLFIIIAIMAGMFGPGGRVGECTRTQYSNGRTLENQRGHQQIFALNHRYLRRLDLHEPGLCHTDDSGVLPGSDHAGYWQIPLDMKEKVFDDIFFIINIPPLHYSICEAKISCQKKYDQFH